MAVRTKRRTFEEVFTEAGIIPEWMERGFKKGIVHGREEGLEQGREEGLEKGREKGLEEGLEQASIQIAKNLLAEGSTHEFIQKITGLSLETVKKLESQVK